MGFDSGFKKIAMEKEAFIVPALRMLGGGLVRAGAAGASALRSVGRSGLSGLSSAGKVGSKAVSALGRGAKFVGNSALDATGMRGPIGAGLAAYGIGSDINSGYRKGMGGFGS